MAGPRWSSMQKKFAILILVSIFLLSLVSCAGNPSSTPKAEPSSSAILATATPVYLNQNFDNLPEGVPSDWQILYASFDPKGVQNAPTKAGVKDNHFIIDNQGTYSGQYALYTGGSSISDVQFSVDVMPDGQTPIGIFLVCRYSEQGWYQFRISGGGTSIQRVLPTDNIFAASILKEGPGVNLDDGTHRVTVSCQGDNLSLKVDDKDIVDTPADFFSSGLIGFGVESYDVPGGRKAFDGLEIQSFETALGTTAPASATALPTITATPFPTSTPTALPTLRPTPIAENELVLYQTDFDKTDSTLKQWNSFAYSYASGEFSKEDFSIPMSDDGYYHIYSTAPNQRIFSIYDVDLGTGDVDLSIKSPIKIQQAGLVCRYSDTGWYQFMMDPNDTWSIRIAKFDENGKIHFIKLAEGSFYFSRYGSLELRAECKGDRLTFYANSTMLSSIHESTLTNGKVGLAGWGYDQPEQVAMFNSFTVNRAQWLESTVPGPAPTPDANGVIYTTDFARLSDLSQYFFIQDAGVIGIPGSYMLIGGPGGISPHTYRYINDFDPGVDVEISADLNQGAVVRALICRYSEDGWYQAHYIIDAGGSAVTITRVERDSQGKLTDVVLGMDGRKTKEGLKLTLTCSGNQITTSLNDEVRVQVEDSMWRTGRYGIMVMDTPPGNLRSGFTSLTVRQAPPPLEESASSTPESIISDTPDLIFSNFRLDANAPGVEIKDGVLTLSPTKENAIHLNSASSQVEDETALEMEFPQDGSGEIVMHCRLGSPNFLSLGIRSNGEWNIDADKDRLASGSDPSIIQPGKNQFTLKCVGNQLTAIANGKTLATVEYLSYDPSTAFGQVGIDILSGPVRIDSIVIKILKPYVPPAPPPSPLLNLVVLQTYTPGQVITQTDFVSHFMLPQLPPLWQALWGRGDSTVKPGENGLFLENHSKDGPLLVFYNQDLNDMSVEVSAEAIFGVGNSSMSLVCRSNSVGYYGFSIQPDGYWAITQNPSLSAEFKRIPETILAHGNSSAIKPDRNQMTAVCQGSELIFTVNGEEVGRTSDDLFIEGKVGVDVRFDSSGTFTDFTVARAE